jgi:hypothetical protein
MLVSGFARTCFEALSKPVSADSPPWRRDPQMPAPHRSRHRFKGFAAFVGVCSAAIYVALGALLAVSDADRHRDWVGAALVVFFVGAFLYEKSLVFLMPGIRNHKRLSRWSFGGFVFGAALLQAASAVREGEVSDATSRDALAALCMIGHGALVTFAAFGDGFLGRLRRCIPSWRRLDRD